MERARVRLLAEIAADDSDGPVPDAGLLRLLADTHTALQALQVVESQRSASAAAARRARHAARRLDASAASPAPASRSRR